MAEQLSSADLLLTARPRSQQGSWLEQGVVGFFTSIGPSKPGVPLGAYKPAPCMGAGRPLAYWRHAPRPLPVRGLFHHGKFLVSGQWDRPTGGLDRAGMVGARRAWKVSCRSTPCGDPDRALGDLVVPLGRPTATTILEQGPAARPASFSA